MHKKYLVRFWIRSCLGYNNLLHTKWIWLSSCDYIQSLVCDNLEWDGAGILPVSAWQLFHCQIPSHLLSDQLSSLYSVISAQQHTSYLQIDVLTPVKHTPVKYSSWPPSSPLLLIFLSAFCCGHKPMQSIAKWGVHTRLNSPHVWWSTRALTYTHPPKPTHISAFPSVHQ